MRHDVIVVGGGPAGLSAALVLGRCRRTVLVVDANEPRNQASRALHGYLTRDGVNPWALRRSGRAEVARYPTVTLHDAKVTAARRDEGGFEVELDGGDLMHSRLLLLATGRVDPLPELPGFATFFGRGVYHCPYCDGWEHCDQSLGVFGNDQNALDLAAQLQTWSQSVTIYANGAPQWGEPDGEMSAEQLTVITKPIARLDGTAQCLKRVLFTDGTGRDCDALFFCTACLQRSPLPEQLGCHFDADESVLCSGHAAKGVEGLFVAGNVRGGIHLAITAAAEGAEAAIAMNRALRGASVPVYAQSEHVA